ncbi:AAA family ATPase [Haloarcula halophila]|uniref:AAA family ATPase n=1 Tax=Haloarcula TaxID=2237 RepID=UPI0023E46682|nr:AAA family ATPase [Halomicroarcula sp. DFY41]
MSLAVTLALFVVAVLSLLPETDRLPPLLLVGAVVGATVGTVTTFDPRYAGIAAGGLVIWSVVYLLVSDTADTEAGEEPTPRIRKPSELPDFDDVGGLEDLKQRLEERVIAPITSPDAYEEYDISPVNGILLYGPPGCGKTFVANALAGESGFALISATPTDITSKWVGEAAQNIQVLFETARANEPCVLLLDELDAVAASRSEMGTSSQQQMVNQLLVELAAIDGSDVVVVGTTNRLEDIDTAIRRSGRFDDRIEVPPPDAGARREILRVALDGRPVTSTLDLSKTVSATAGYASSDVETLAEIASRHALSASEPIDEHHLSAAVAETGTSIANWLPAYDSVTEGRTDVSVVQPDGVNISATETLETDVQTRFSDVLGMEETKQRIQTRLLDPVRNNAWYETVGLADVDGALFHGPSSSILTKLARATAGELGLPLVVISPEQLGTELQRGPANRMSELFAIARANTPCVVVITDLNRLAPITTDVRQGITFVDRLAGQLRQLAAADLLVIGTATGTAEVASPVRDTGCFEVRIEVSRPDVDTRKTVLRSTLTDEILEDGFDWDQAAAAVAGLASDDIRSVAEMAARTAVRNEQPLSTEGLAAAASEYQSDGEDGPPRYIT